MPTLLDAAGLRVPESCTGESVLPLLRGETPNSVAWRDWMHGECAPGYHPEEACHFLTDGRTIYAWYSQTGRELMFDLETDPHELHDLMQDPGAGEHLPHRGAGTWWTSAGTPRGVHRRRASDRRSQPHAAHPRCRWDVSREDANTGSQGQQQHQWGSAVLCRRRAARAREEDDVN